MPSPEQIKSMGNIELSKTQKMGLAQGDDGADSAWKSMINARLKVDGNYVFWKTRGGSTVVNSFFGNILTIYPFQAVVGNTTYEYIGVHTSAGKVFLWDINNTNPETNPDEIVASGFSTTKQIQFAHIGALLYMFDYDGGKATYYDLKKENVYNFLSYNNSYITNSSWLAEGVATENIFNFREGQDIIVFPNKTPESAGDTIYSSSADDSDSINPASHDVNSFLYVYNDGQYMEDSNGTTYKATQFITFSEGDGPISFTVQGSGSAFEIKKYYIPLNQSGQPGFEAYRAKIRSIETNVITFKDPVGITQTTQVGGLEDYTHENIIFPHNPDLEELLGVASNKKLNEAQSSVITNDSYSPPRIFRQYVVYDLLSDGSVTITGKPVSVEANAEVIHADGGTAVNLTINPPSGNIVKRFLCATRWQPNQRQAFDPSSQQYDNSPLFIVANVDTGSVFQKDKTPDARMVRPITEQQPLVAGVSELFLSDSIFPHSIGQFTGSLMLGGYSVNRPVPKPYNSPQSAEKENIFVDITPTQQLPNDMALAFQFGYTDGKRSEIVETEGFLQEGTVQESQPAACDQTRAGAGHQVTAGCSTDGDLQLTYDGVTVTVSLSVANHASPANVAEEIRQAVEANADIALDISAPGSGNLVYTEKRYGASFNGNVIDVDPAATGVTFDTQAPTLLGASDPVSTIEGYIDTGSTGTCENPPTGFNMTATFKGVDTTVDLQVGGYVGPLLNALNNEHPNWTFTSEIQETSPFGGAGKPYKILGESVSTPPGTYDLSFKLNYYTDGNNLCADGRRIFFTGGEGTIACQQASASVDVNANNLPSGTSEDHTITVDGNDTAPITINDTDTPSQIVDKYVSAIESTASIDFDWEAGKVDNSGTWRLLLTFREFGTRGNDKTVSVANVTDIDLTVNSPSSGGSQGDSATSGEGIEVSANRLQIHSLNTLISTVFVLGMVDDGVKRFHLIDEYDITDPQAHGMNIDLPNTEAALNDIESTVYLPTASEDILESIELNSKMIVGTPFQQFSISAQQSIVDNSPIQRVMPIDFDSDKSTMRYRVAIFTDQNIQVGYFVEQASAFGSTFSADVEIANHGIVATNREGITTVGNSTFFESRNGLHIWEQGQQTKILNRERYAVLRNNEIVDVVHNENENEYWFIFRNNTAIVFDPEARSFTRMKYEGPSVGTLRAGTFYGGIFYIGLNSNLCSTDIQGVYDDVGQGPSDSQYVTGYILSNHFINELAQVRLFEITIGGQDYTCQLDIDLQPERFEHSSSAWDKDFNADFNGGQKLLKMHGAPWQIHRRAIMPRMRLKFYGANGGHLAYVRVKQSVTENKGKARQ